jgi:hypothetical protein
MQMNLVSYAPDLLDEDNLNIQDCSVVAPPLHAPSRAPLLLPLLLSHNVPLPRVH